ncbi:MAG: hypothetical protein JW914_02200 [Syntrophaceae bacterium]|nr:hypothetical protein [Syntrophaceae bacterium]
MLMLTHTYLLQSYLNEANAKKHDLDVYVYNIVPDLLTIHPQINSRQTHDIKRTLNIPLEYSGAAYVMFHLLLDDLAHYGFICADEGKEFDPDSQGYSYIKGKPLINPLLEFYKDTKNEISYNEAVYRSHLIIEMIYDLAILKQINSSHTIDLLSHAVDYTAKNKMPQFVRTMKWLYNMEEEQVNAVIKEASVYLTNERMSRIMDLDGRIKLYAAKFGAKISENDIYTRVRNIFLQASTLLDRDDDIFLRQSAEIIKEYGWRPL